MNELIEAIDREARSLPIQCQREVLDFIGYLHSKYEHQADPDWLERAWGISPEFPDRLPQPPLMDIQSF